MVLRGETEARQDAAQVYIVTWRPIAGTANDHYCHIVSTGEVACDAYPSLGQYRPEEAIEVTTHKQGHGCNAHSDHLLCILAPATVQVRC
jgi:hypothetical protein